MASNSTLEEFTASNTEIVLPPMLCLIAAAFGLFILVFNTNRKCCWRLPTVEANSVLPTMKELVITVKSRSWTLFSHFDTSVLESLHLFVNTPTEIFKISLPALLSLAFCPLTLFMHKPIIQLFWPKNLFPEHPNVNDGIACFLVPAGMVYAISFGFAFQQVMAKQQSTDMYVGQEVDRLHRLLTMVSKLKLNSIANKLQIYQLIKNEMIKFILCLQDRNLPSGLADLMDILCLICEDDVGWNEKYNSTVKKAITNLITDTPYAVGSKAPSKQRINIVQWAFLETLGYFTFLGILLVVGHSYRIELSMCIITVVSITMLCYIIADMDSPFHGYFRTDLSIIEGLATRLEELYTLESKQLVLRKTNALSME